MEPRGRRLPGDGATLAENFLQLWQHRKPPWPWAGLGKGDWVRGAGAARRATRGAGGDGGRDAGAAAARDALRARGTRRATLGGRGARRARGDRRIWAQRGAAERHHRQRPAAGAGIARTQRPTESVLRELPRDTLAHAIAGGEVVHQFAGRTISNRLSFAGKQELPVLAKAIAVVVLFRSLFQSLNLKRITFVSRDPLQNSSNVILIKPLQKLEVVVAFLNSVVRMLRRTGIGNLLSDEFGQKLLIAVVAAIITGLHRKVCGSRGSR